MGGTFLYSRRIDFSGKPVVFPLSNPGEGNCPRISMYFSSLEGNCRGRWVPFFRCEFSSERLGNLSQSQRGFSGCPDLLLPLQHVPFTLCTLLWNSMEVLQLHRSKGQMLACETGS